MIEVTSRMPEAAAIPHIGSQPIALAAGAFVVIMLGIGSIALWRAYTGFSPEQDRVVAARQLQAQAAQASEQLVEKTKGLEVTQQESIDQLQVVQDQLQTVRRLLAAQQADTKRLSEQVSQAHRGGRRIAAVVRERPGFRRIRAPPAATGRSAPDRTRPGAPIARREIPPG